MKEKERKPVFQEQQVKKNPKSREEWDNYKGSNREDLAEKDNPNSMPGGGG